MADWTTIDYFADSSLTDDPYPYLDLLREECPVLPLTHLGVVAVTGYDEASEIYRDTDAFSSCNSVIGPYAAFPVPLEGDDITDIVASIATSSLCMSTWSPWTRPTTPANGRSSRAC